MSTFPTYFYSNGYQYIDAHFSSSYSSSISLDVDDANNNQKYSQLIVSGTIHPSANNTGYPRVAFLNSSGTAHRVLFTSQEAIYNGYFYHSYSGSYEIRMTTYGQGNTGSTLADRELINFYMEIDTTYNASTTIPKRKHIWGFTSNSSSTYPLLSYFAGEIYTASNDISDIKFTFQNNQSFGLNAQVYGVCARSL